MIKFEETKPDENNIFQRTEYYEDRKIVKTIKLLKINKSVAERKNNWKPFGLANDINNHKVTTVSEEDVFMESSPFNDNITSKSKFVDNCDCGGVHFSVPCKKYRDKDFEDDNFKEKHKTERRDSVGSFTETNSTICKICNGNHWTRVCPNKKNENEKDEKIVKNEKIVKDEKDAIIKNENFKTTIQITNLSVDILDYELFEIFSKVGIIKSLSIVKKYDSQDSKGVAFIKYDNEKTAENAIKIFNNHGLDNLLLKVDFVNLN
jgi:hypothetical protein